MDARRIIQILGLTPHAAEGGYFVETYRDPARDADGARARATAIYFLLTAEAFSAMHRLRGDEIYHFYSGDPVEVLLLHPGGRGEVRRLGADLERGERPQLLVPGGVWQGSRLAPGGRHALLGTTMSPGFEYADYEDGAATALVHGWPGFEREIRERIR